MRAGLPPPPVATPKAVLPTAPLAGRYRPFTPRQRLRLLGGTVIFVLVLWLLLIYQPGRKPPRHYPPPPDVATCKPGQTTNCVGAPAQVLLLPTASAPPASAPAR